jgi:hypothetical protein
VHCYPFCFFNLFLCHLTLQKQKPQGF